MSILKSGIQFMHEKHGIMAGHVCGDCIALHRHPRVPTICSCKEYPTDKTNRPERMIAAYERGESWRGDYRACGIWKGIVKKAAKMDAESMQEIFELY